jgi:Cu-Zn family superoxide dismutase
MKILHELIFY